MKKECNSDAGCADGLVCKTVPQKLDTLRRSLLLMLGVTDSTVAKATGYCLCPDGFQNVFGTTKCQGQLHSVWRKVGLNKESLLLIYPSAFCNRSPEWRKFQKNCAVKRDLVGQTTMTDSLLF